VIFSFAIYAKGSTNSLKDEEEILIQEKPTSPSGGPRMPSSTRIEAYYDTGTSCIYLNLSNAGSLVSIDVNNLTTNETVSCSIPGTGLSIVPISGNSGYWTIVLNLEDGRVFEGGFTI
jgi:hypothetical protein